MPCDVGGAGVAGHDQRPRSAHRYGGCVTRTTCANVLYRPQCGPTLLRVPGIQRRSSSFAVLTGWSLLIFALKAIAFLWRFGVAVVWASWLLVLSLVLWDARQLPKKLRKQVLPFVLSESKQA